MNINDVLNINIALQSLPTNVPSFGTTLVLTRENPVASITQDTVAVYTSAAAVGTDWGTNSKAYAAALNYFAQNPSCTTLLVAPCKAAVAQIDTVTVLNAINPHTYTFSIMGFPVSYANSTSQTTAQIATALQSAAAAVITANSLPVTAGSVVGSGFTLTGNSAGQGFTDTTTDATNVGIVNSTAVVNAATDVAAIQATGSVGNSWYSVVMVGTMQTNVDATALATYIEAGGANIFIYFDPNTNPSSVTGSFASAAFTAKYNRTLVASTRVTGLAQAQVDEAALLSLNQAYTPGSKNWAYSQLAGITPDAFTETQKANLDAINCNYYLPLSVFNVFYSGKMSSGQWVDTITGVDWIKQNLQTNLLALLVSTPKIPYTDGGISLVTNVIRNTLQQAVTLGILAPSNTLPNGYTVTAPLASSISPTQKNSRILASVTFQANLAGAINALVPVNGTVGLFN